MNCLTTSGAAFIVNLRTFARGTRFHFILCQVWQRLTNRPFASAAENFLARRRIRTFASHPLSSMASTQSIQPQSQSDQINSWCILGGMCAVIVWSYWNTIESLMGEWVRPQYSHGWLVPVFTAVLLAMRHEPFQKVANSVRWWGVAIMSAGMALRLVGTYFQIHTFDNLSIIPVLMGAFVVVGGWPALRWSAAPLGFLVFMLPLPTELQRMVLVRMQHWAAVMSNYTLQTMGADSYLEGATSNLISIGDNIHLNVEEACSGLRMATIFIAMAVALTMILERPWWEKTLIIVSAIPIAVAVNVIRIVVTALLFMMLGQDSEFAKHFFHDLAGLFMMPIALGFMYVEMQILDHVFIEEETRVIPHTTGFGPAPAARRQTPTRVP